MNMVSRGFPPGDLRVSDADRDRAVGELSEHFQTGRLTQEEFGDRSDRALRARTGDELTGLLADLPLYPEAPAGPWPAADSLPGFAGRYPSRRLGAGSVVLGVIAVIVVAEIVVNGIFGGHSGHFYIGVPLPLVLVVLFVLRRLRS